MDIVEYHILIPPNGEFEFSTSDREKKMFCSVYKRPDKVLVKYYDYDQSLV